MLNIFLIYLYSFLRSVSRSPKFCKQVSSNAMLSDSYFYNISVSPLKSKLAKSSAFRFINEISSILKPDLFEYLCTG